MGYVFFLRGIWESSWILYDPYCTACPILLRGYYYSESYKLKPSASLYLAFLLHGTSFMEYALHQEVACFLRPHHWLVYPAHLFRVYSSQGFTFLLMLSAFLSLLRRGSLYRILHFLELPAFDNRRFALEQSMLRCIFFPTVYEL